MRYSSKYQKATEIDNVDETALFNKPRKGCFTFSPRPFRNFYVNVAINFSPLTDHSSTSNVSSPIRELGISWRFLKANGTEVMVETVVHVGDVCPSQSFLQLRQCILGSHVGRSVLAVRLIEIEASTMDATMAIYCTKPPEE